MALDKDTNAEVTLDFVHQKVHDDQMYSASWYYTVTAASTQDFTIVVGSGEPHMTFHVATGGQCLVYLYEGITVTAGNTGTAVNIYNMHRDSANSGTVLCFYDSVWTTTGGGTALVTELIPGGTNTPSRVGASARPGTEWILKSNESYGVRLLNQAASTIGATVEIEFYELSI